MKTYDKASWHIDGGEKALDVVARFRIVFEFLLEKQMLSADGIETLEYAMDSSISLNSIMVNEKGNWFLERYYDEVLSPTASMMQKNLLDAYEKYMNEQP